MGKWTNKILEPSDSPDSDNHIDIEDIARLAEGTVDKAANKHLYHHINRCQRCYEILHRTIQDAQFAGSRPPDVEPWWKSKITYALAASILLIFIIGGQLAYKYWSRDPKVIIASLKLDQSLKDILLEDNALEFGDGARLHRLLTILQQKGLQIKMLKRVVLSKPYYQKKSLFGPKEVLTIRIENDVAYLEVKEVQ